jgi:hypothetical protein
MLEFVTIIMVTMTADGPVIGQHPRYFKSVSACEKQLFEFYQSSGGEIRTLPNKDIIYEIGGVVRKCKKMQLDKELLNE